jgi:hypothetical protein
MLSPRSIVLLLSVSLLAGCAVGAGESGARITTPAQVTTAGNAMLTRLPSLERAALEDKNLAPP